MSGTWIFVVAWSCLCAGFIIGNLLGRACERSIARSRQQAEGFEHCHRCGRGNTIWFAPSPLWNAVMRGGSINGDSKYNDLVCATCFMELAEDQGVASRFKVFAEQLDVELETTTPSGRVWDEDRQLWVDQPTEPPAREAA